MKNDILQSLRVNIVNINAYAKSPSVKEFSLFRVGNQNIYMNGLNLTRALPGQLDY